MHIRSFFRNRFTWLAAAALALAVGIFLSLPNTPAVRAATSAAKPVATQSAAPATPDWSTRIAAAAPLDFPSLAKQILAQKSSGSRDRALAALISEWIKRNPQGLRAFLDTLDVDDAGGLGADFFTALAGALPYVSDAAASSPYMSELVSEFVEARAGEDPAAALAWAEEWLLDDALEKARVTIAGALAAEAPDEALKQLAKIKNPLRRVQALSAISEGYAENDPKAARAWAEKLPYDAEVATAMDGILRVMAGQDPQSAAKAFEAVHSRIAEKYAKLVAADRVKRGLPGRPPLDAQGNPIVDDAGGENAAPVESPDLDMLGDSSETIARALALGDPAAALKWADSLPGVLQAAGKRAALTTWAESQPEAAYRYCVQNSCIDADTFAGIFESWGEQNPEAAATAATGVSSDRLRGEAISNAIGAWAGQAKSPAAVADWISHLSGESDRNIANRALASALDADEPQFAWDRVMQISNPDDRREVLSSTFASLVANQPKLAAAALDSASNLTQEERRRLARMLDSKSR